jgi:hypothetical protein
VEKKPIYIKAMSLIIKVGGNLTRTVGGNMYRYAKGDIVTTSRIKVIETAKGSITYGPAEPHPETKFTTGEPGYIIIISGKTHPKWKYPIENFKYSEGKLYKEKEYNRENQLYEVVPYTDEIPENVQVIKENLDKLMKNSEGKKLLKYFENEKKKVLIERNTSKDEAKKDRNYTIENKIFITGEPVAMPREDSYLPVKTEPYIVLAHELAHAMTYHTKQKIQEPWFYYNGVFSTHDEIYATHIENKIRMCAGIKLRHKYENDMTTDRSDVLDEKRNSLYINKNEDYPTYPAKKLDIKEAFNYNTIKKDETL